jgi:hypothetical protein
MVGMLLIVGVLAAQEAQFELPRTFEEEGLAYERGVEEDALLAGDHARAVSQSHVEQQRAARKGQARRKTERTQALYVTRADPDAWNLDAAGSAVDRRLLILRKQRAAAVRRGDLTAMARLDVELAAARRARLDAVYVRAVKQQELRVGPQTLLEARVTSLEAQRNTLMGHTNNEARDVVDQKLRRARSEAQAWLRPQQEVWLEAEVSPSMLTLQDRIAGLKDRREHLRTWSDNEERARVDRELVFLRRVAEGAGSGISDRLTLCAAGLGHLPLVQDAAAGGGALGVDGVPGRSAGMLSQGLGPCLATAQNVPTLAEAVENKRRTLKETRWDLGNIHEKRALEAELRVLDNGGVP